MEKQIPIPPPLPTPHVVPKSKCKTCAYRTPSSPEELEMMIGYYMERPEAHRCHERDGCFCLGSHEQVSELEHLVYLKIMGKP